MGKSKQAKEKKFDRNVEISAPILDPEIIKAIHTPPKGQRLDIKHGGFKALLSDLNSQDSTDELMPLNDNHVPSYIGISCAVSGYSNYAPLGSRPRLTQSPAANSQSGDNAVPSRSRATSPVLNRNEPQINHIKIDKSNIQSVDQERKELTEKLSASVHERQRSPSPCIPPTEDDRHHGAYVGARYCPLPAPDKLVNKHIPLLGIDDDQNPEEAIKTEEESKKVEQKIASLYGGDFVENWRESMTHKTKKELSADLEAGQQEEPMWTKPQLKPTPPPAPKQEPAPVNIDESMDLSSNAKVLASVDKQFLNKLLSDDNPPMPALPPTPKTPTQLIKEETLEAQSSPAHSSVETTNLLNLETDQDVEHESVQNPVEEQSTEARGNICEEPKETAFRGYENSPQTGAEPAFEASVGIKPEPTLKPLDASKHEQLASAEVQSKEDLLGQTTDAITDQVKQESPVPPQELNLTGDDDGEPMSLLPDVQQHGEQQHIEYEIRATSPVDNESSPVKIPNKPEPILEVDEQAEADLVNQATDLKLTTNSGREVAPALVDANFENVVGAINESPTVVSDSNDGHYYLDLLERERSFIAEQVAKAESILAIDGSEMDEDAEGRVRSVIGKANLLISRKFNQFKGLCESNINKKDDDQFATLNEDLAGFWDMLEIQISNVRESFETLWQVEKTNWNTNSESAKGECTIQTEKSTSAKPVKLSAQKDQERRDRLKEHINQMKQNQATSSNAEATNDVVIMAKSFFESRAAEAEDQVE